MERRSFFGYSARGLLLGVSALACTGYTPPASGVYLAADGQDSSSGRSPDDPWRTIGRLNESLIDGSITWGQSILFRRGDEFFGEVKTMARPESPADARLVISAYGDGDPPKISGYKIVGVPSAWQRVDHGVWRVNLVDRVSYRGNITNNTANTGFLRVDGQIFGVKRWDSQSLSGQWDFFNDDTYLYVKSVENPAEITNDLRVAVDGTLITGSSGVCVNGLDLVGTGGHGYRQTAADNTEFSECRVHEIGGSQFTGTDKYGQTTRYGNGIELWMGSANATVTHNEIFDIYDVACTMQGEQKGEAQSIVRCNFTSNRIWNCSQAFEYWGSGTNSEPGAGFVECSFTDNVCVNGGHSWGYSVRPDQAGRGNFLMAYSQDVPVDIRVNGNLFFDARDCYQYISSNGFRLRDGFVCDRNVIVLRPGTLIQANLPFTINESADWVAVTQQDLHSRWLTVPSSVITGADALNYVHANSDELRLR